jgi:acetyl esterase/lipase
MAVILQRITAALSSALIAILSLFGQAAPNAVLNVPYAKDSVFQMMDIAFPEQSEGSVSAVMIIHGGGWITGTRLTHGHAGQCEGFAKRGFVGVAIDHRLALGPANYADMLDDIGYALEELQRQAGERGLTINNIALWGYSSGAHLALLYAFSRHGSSPIDIAFCAGMAPPSYFLDPDWIAEVPIAIPVFALVLKAPLTAKNITTKYAGLAADASLYTHLDKDCPPVIACFGKLDDRVPYSNALLMQEKLARLGAQGYQYEYLLFENSGHNLENDPETSARFNAAFDDFMEKYM